MTLRLRCAVLGALSLLFALPGSSHAGLMYLGSGTNPESNHALAASAEFSLSGTTLTIVLKNASTQAYSAPRNKAVQSSILTALFVEINPVPNSFILNSATPSAVIQHSGTAPTNLAVSGKPQNPDGTQGGWNLQPKDGLGTAGFGIFNGKLVGNFDYGIINAAYNTGDGNKLVNSTPLVQDTLTFGISVGENFSLDHIKKVSFQYGTSLKEPNLVGVLQPPDGSEGAEAIPEPSTLAMAFGSLAMLGVVRVVRGRRERGVGGA